MGFGVGPRMEEEMLSNLQAPPGEGELGTPSPETLRHLGSLSHSPVTEGS